MPSDLEAALLRQYDQGGNPSAIFIVGAPRTGSTPFYQAVVHAFRLPFISNHVNSTTPDRPLVGILESYRQSTRETGRLSSQYGKTSGEHSPSEGSAVMMLWCGGGHPSETASPGVLRDRKEHMRATMRAVEVATGKPLVTKNAWNCFRLESLANEFPKAGFVWIRRDVGAAARSDLAARYETKHDPSIWNSATPRNLPTLQAMPYWEQVVENQFEFSRAISEAAAGLSPRRFAEVWYEDFCVDPTGSLETLASRLDVLPELAQKLPPEAVGVSKRDGLPAEDRDRIEAYLRADPVRWNALRRS